MLDYDTSDADYFKYVYWSGFDGTCMSEESYSRTYLCEILWEIALLRLILSLKLPILPFFNHIATFQQVQFR